MKKRSCGNKCWLLITLLCCLSIMLFIGCDEDDGTISSGSREDQNAGKITEESSKAYKVEGVFDVRRDGTQSTGPVSVPWGVVGIIKWSTTVDPEDYSGITHGFNVIGVGEGEVNYNAPPGTACLYNRGAWEVVYDLSGKLYADCTLVVNITEKWINGESEMECPPYASVVETQADYTMSFSDLSFPHEETGWTINTEVTEAGIYWTNTFVGKHPNGSDINETDCGWFSPAE